MNNQDSIGTAELKEDRTLIFKLFTNDRGISGHAMKIIKPDDPQYQYYLDHIGGIKVGEYKNIPPFIS